MLSTSFLVVALFLLLAPLQQQRHARQGADLRGAQRGRWCGAGPASAAKRYEREKADFEKIPWYERMWIGTGRDARLEPTDALQAAKTFQQACEKMPDEIPKSALDDKLQQLNDHYTGKNPCRPNSPWSSQRRVSFLQDVYTPGPRWENGLSGSESAWLSAQNLRFGNTLGIALLGPIFGAPVRPRVYSEEARSK